LTLAPRLFFAYAAVLTNASLETAVPGLWAAGAVRHGCGGTLDDAVADARVAAAGIAAQLR
jgi:thioredoxin reductase (NADPH)